MALRCDAAKLRQMGRASRGVGVMKLAEGDELAGMDILPFTQRETREEGPWLLVVTAQGLGKRVPSNSFSSQLRGGKGIACSKLATEDSIVALHVVGVPNEDKEEMVVGSHGGILNRFRIKDIPVQGRAARGVKIMRLQDGDLVKSVSLVPSSGLDLAEETPLTTPELDAALAG